jgi:hypothetical protein
MARWKSVSTVAMAGLLAGSVLGPSWLSTTRAETVACGAWPGEPNPLPRIDDPDPFLARWAALRAQELARMAMELEASDPSEANATWEHLRCLDPAGDLARRERGEPGAARRAETPPVASPPRPRAPDWSPIDAKLRAAEALVRSAHFERALQAADELRPELAPVEDAPGAIPRRTGLEVLCATAEIALGRDQAARESFGRALAADPDLELDAGTTSPKIRRVFEMVRSDAGSPSP